MNVHEAITLFLEYLSVERRLSVNTVGAYRRDLAIFRAHLDEASCEAVSSLTKNLVRRFLATQFRDGLKATTVARRMSALKSFFKFLVRRGCLEIDPSESLRAPKAPKRSPRFLSAEDTERLLSVSEGHSPIQVRDRAILEMAYGGGLRVSEVCGINLSDLALGSCTVRIRGKGNKERIVPIGRMAIISLQAWLGVRSKLGEGGDAAALFRNWKGGRLSTRSVQRLVARGRERCLQGGATPHWLRHACATHMLSSGADLRAIQELLGHSSLSTTQKYTHVDVAQLMSVYDRAHPRAKVDVHTGPNHV
jgi:integrase/recombinase XerC